MKLEREKENPPGFQRFVAPDGSSAHPAGFEVRNLNRRDCPLGRSLVSVEKGADEISAAGGRQCLSHGRRGFSSVKRINRKPVTHEGQPVFDGAPGEIRTHGLPLRRTKKAISAELHRSPRKSRKA